jgi:ABC-type nickel/cobalt efflux system permease component RcnA
VLGILGLGFALGLQHALEADHLAAVASVAAGSGRPGEIVKHGLTWGLGHALTLLALAGLLLVLGRALPEAWAGRLELAVGAMLMALGVQALWRVARRRRSLRTPAHPHQHLHLHPYPRQDPPGFRWRTLAVGLMHGLAGSAALVLLALGQVGDPLWGVAYVLLFGVGSMVGMAALSAVVAVPLSRTARSVSLAGVGLQALIGVLTTGLGIATVAAHWG